MSTKRIKIIETSEAPRAIGPYSQGVRAGGFLFCSGQIPIDPGSGGLVLGGIVPQTHRVMQNLESVLRAAGSSWADVVKTTVYLLSLEDFAQMNTTYAEYVGDDPPARATVEVSRLPRDVLVEIDAVAWVASS